jgi:transposase
VAVEQEAQKRPEATADDAPGRWAGDGTGLRAAHRNGGAFSLWQADWQLSGAIPCEESSGGRQRLGHISKQGNSLLRFLLVEAAHAAVRCDGDWKRRYLHLAMRREQRIANVAMARRLGVQLYWMWRKGWDYQQVLQFGSHAGELVTEHGVK